MNFERFCFMMFIGAIFSLPSMLDAQEFDMATGAADRAQTETETLQRTPIPTVAYGLRPTYRPSRSKSQSFSPELEETELENEDEEPKSEAEQELDDIFGQ